MRIDRFLVFLVILVACKPASVPTTTIVVEEDLSIYRPEIPKRVMEQARPDSIVLEPPVVIEGHIGAELDTINQLIYERNAKKQFWDGYTVQVYNGTSRSIAYDARDRLEEFTDEFDPVIDYRQPNYKVKIGKFHDRLEAHRFFMEIKSEFPRALMLPERIELLLNE